MKQSVQEEFKVRTTGEGDVRVVEVAGELDISTVQHLRSVLNQAAEQAVHRLVVDLRGVSFVDSVGVGALLHTKRRLGQEARMAVVLAPQSYARVIFDVVGADSLVDVFETLEEAAAHVAA